MGRRYRDVADNQDNRRRYGKRYGRPLWFRRATVIVGVALIVGLLALQFGPALMDCDARYSSTPRVGGQFLMRLLVDGRRLFC